MCPPTTSAPNGAGSSGAFEATPLASEVLRSGKSPGQTGSSFGVGSTGWGTPLASLLFGAIRGFAVSCGWVLVCMPIGPRKLQKDLSDLRSCFSLQAQWMEL